MHIRKQSLPAPGRVPLYPRALQAGMGPEAPRRIAGFRAAPRTAKGRFFRIADLGCVDFAGLFAAIAWLEIIQAAKGFPVPYGTGVAAVRKDYAAVAQAAAAAMKGIHL